eukprot:509843_1
MSLIPETIKRTDWYQYVLLISGTVTTMTIILIVFIELYNTYQRIKKQRTKSSTTSNRKLSVMVSYYFTFPLLFYLCYVIHSIANMLTWFKISDNCMLIYYISSISYILSKAFLYEFFILRLYVAYKKSCFQYNPHILTFLAIFVVFYMITIIILITVNWNVVLVPNSIINGCLSNTPFFIYAIGAGLDQIIAFSTVYLFAKPLIYLLKVSGDFPVNHDAKSHSSGTETTANNARTRSTSSSPNSNPDPDVALKSEYRIIVKVASLSFIASITTAVVLLFQVILFPNYLLFVVDIFINTLCVALMNKSYSRIYYMVCCLPNRFCKTCIICICCLGGYVEDKSIKSEVQLSVYMDSKQNQSAVV